MSVINFMSNRISIGGIYALVFANISNIILTGMEVFTDRRQDSNEIPVSLLKSGLLLVMRMMVMLGILGIDVISTLIIEGHTNYEVHVAGNYYQENNTYFRIHLSI